MCQNTKRLCDFSPAATLEEITPVT